MIDPPRLAGRNVRHVFVHDMILSASIGVYVHERTALRRIRVNVDLAVDDAPTNSAEAGRSRAGVGQDELRRVLDYEGVVDAVRGVIGAGHVKLVETVAERIAEECLRDARVRLARVRVEKLDIWDDVGAVGVEIERHAASCPRGVVDSQ